jgi:hypothetical protein
VHKAYKEILYCYESFVYFVFLVVRIKPRLDLEWQGIFHGKKSIL